MADQPKSTLRRRGAWYRVTEWVDHPPWRNGLITGVVAAGIHTVGYSLTTGKVSLFFTIFVAVLFFGAGMAAAVRRSERRAAANRGELSTEAPPSDDPLSRDDGRRWRSGIG